MRAIFLLRSSSSSNSMYTVRKCRKKTKKMKNSPKNTKTIIKTKTSMSSLTNTNKTPKMKTMKMRESSMIFANLSKDLIWKHMTITKTSTETLLSGILIMIFHKVNRAKRIKI